MWIVAEEPTAAAPTSAFIPESPETEQPKNAQDESTEIHVVTSINHEINVDSTTTTTELPTLETSTTPPGSYQYISIGTPKPTQDNVLELEKLFLNEKLKVSSDVEKKKRKVNPEIDNSKPAFLNKPVKVDSTITVVSDLYESNTPKIKNTKIYVPSTPPPTSYQAPTEPFSIEPEVFTVNYDTINDDIEYVEVSNDEDEKNNGKPIELRNPKQFKIRKNDNLDDLIIESVEKTLNIHVPEDPKLRHRGVTKSAINKDQEKKVSHPLDIINLLNANLAIVDIKWPAIDLNLH